MKKQDTKILLVDDEPDILEILSYNLSSEGYKIYTAKQAWRLLKRPRKRTLTLSSWMS